MSNPISNLNKLDLLRPQDLNCNIFSVYDYDGFSIQELLCVFFEKINECVEIANATFKLAEWLVSVGLAQEVAKKLEIWLADGTLSTIINETIFKELNDKVNNNTNLINNNINSINVINNKLSNFVSVTDYKTDINTWDDAFLECISNNRNVLIPNGVYDITKTIEIPSDEEGINILGFGSSTILNNKIPNGEFLFHSTFAKRTQLSNFCIDSDNTVIRKGIHFEGSLRGVNISDLWFRNIQNPIKLGEHTWGQTSLNNIRIYQLTNDNKEGSIGIELNSANTVFMNKIEIIGTYEYGLKAYNAHVCSLRDFNIAGSEGLKIKYPIRLENCGRFTIDTGWVEQVDPFESSNGGSKSIYIKNTVGSLNNINIASGSIYGDGGKLNISNVYLGQTISSIVGVNNSQITLSNITHHQALNGYSTDSISDANYIYLNYETDSMGETSNIKKTASVVAITNSQTTVLEDYRTDYINIDECKRVVSKNWQGVRVEFEGLQPEMSHTFICYVRHKNNLNKIITKPTTNYGTQIDGISRKVCITPDRWTRLVYFVRSTNEGRIRMDIVGQAKNELNETEFLVSNYGIYKGIRPNQE